MRPKKRKGIAIKVSWLSNEEENALKELIEASKHKVSISYYKLHEAYKDNKGYYPKTGSKNFEAYSRKIYKPFFDLWRKGIVRMKWKRHGDTYYPVFYLTRDMQKEVNEYLNLKKDYITVRFSEDEARFLEKSYFLWKELKKQGFPDTVQVKIGKRVTKVGTDIISASGLKKVIPIELIASELGISREKAFRTAVRLYRKGQLKAIRGIRPFREDVVRDLLKKEELSWLPSLSKKDIELWVEEEGRNLEKLNLAEKELMKLEETKSDISKVERRVEEILKKNAPKLLNFYKRQVKTKWEGQGLWNYFRDILEPVLKKIKQHKEIAELRYKMASSTLTHLGENSGTEEVLKAMYTELLKMQQEREMWALAHFGITRERGAPKTAFDRDWEESKLEFRLYSSSPLSEKESKLRHKLGKEYRSASEERREEIEETFEKMLESLRSKENIAWLFSDAVLRGEFTPPAGNVSWWRVPRLPTPFDTLSRLIGKYQRYQIPLGVSLEGRENAVNFILAHKKKTQQKSRGKILVRR